MEASSAEMSGRAVFAVGPSGFDDIDNPAFAQRIDRALAAEASVVGQHEVDPHPGLLDRERLDHGAHTGKQSGAGDLEGGIGALAIDIEPKEGLGLKFLGRQADPTCELIAGQNPRLP